MLHNMPEIKTIYNRLKASAKKRGIIFALTLSDLHNLTWPISCPVLGIGLKFNKGKAEDNSYSIDRVDNTKGYSIDNIVVISLKANKLKNAASTDELNKLSKFYTP